MSAALEAYRRLKDAERNRPSEEVIAEWKANRAREAENAKIKRRLPRTP